jgi:hypothetical protein
LIEAQSKLNVSGKYFYGITAAIRSYKIIDETINAVNQLIQGVIEIHEIILTTSYWLHVELGKNI